MQPLQSRQEVDGSRIPELKDIVSDALDRARALGATQAEADVSLQKGLTTTVRLGEVETVEYQRDRGMGVTVYFGKRKGSASTADLSQRAVSETVEKACDIARYTAEDDCAGLADRAIAGAIVAARCRLRAWPAFVGAGGVQLSGHHRIGRAAAARPQGNRDRDRLRGEGIVERQCEGVRRAIGQAGQG